MRLQCAVPMSKKFHCGVVCTQFIDVTSFGNAVLACTLEIGRYIENIDISYRIVHFNIKNFDI